MHVLLSGEKEKKRTAQRIHLALGHLCAEEKKHPVATERERMSERGEKEQGKEEGWRDRE